MTKSRDKQSKSTKYKKNKNATKIRDRHIMRVMHGKYIDEDYEDYEDYEVINVTKDICESYDMTSFTTLVMSVVEFVFN